MSHADRSEYQAARAKAKYDFAYNLFRQQDRVNEISSRPGIPMSERYLVRAQAIDDLATMLVTYDHSDEFKAKRKVLMKQRHDRYVTQSQLYNNNIPPHVIFNIERETTGKLYTECVHLLDRARFLPDMEWVADDSEDEVVPIDDVIEE